MWSALLSAQDTLAVNWASSGQKAAVPNDLLPDYTALPAKRFGRKSIKDLHAAGYLEASIDSLYTKNDTLYPILHLGKRYTWAHLDLSKIPPLLAEGVRLPRFRDKSFSYQEISNLFERLLTRAENSGYPFAAVRLDSIDLDDGIVRARVHVNLNDYVTIAQIKMAGDLKISMPYLRYYLGIEPGQPFDRSKVMAVEDRLAERPFIKSAARPTISFLGTGATLNLDLDRKPANQFDILLGLLPSPVEGRRFQLTGNVNVVMENQFGAGERFHFNFESLRPQTQELELDFSYPFIFDLPFGADAEFDLYKRDTTYLDVNYELGIEYYINQRTTIKFFARNYSSRLLGINTRTIRNTKLLPINLDLSRNTFGFEITNSKLNYRFNPRKGRLWKFRAGAGTKKIKKNESILAISDPLNPEFNFESLYDDLDLNSFQYSLSSELAFYIPLLQQSTIKLSNRSGFLDSGTDVLNNELFRIGGTKLLRGFNEEAIFANLYSVFTAEYRLLFSQNSNLFFFTDIGYTQQQAQATTIHDQLVGIGTGINLETKVGVFAISYAIGRQRNVPFSFREGKIHFGMVSLF